MVASSQHSRFSLYDSIATPTFKGCGMCA